MSATSANASRSKPRAASAGVPIRTPELTIGGRGSNGTALRFTVIPDSVQPVLGLLAVEFGVAQVDQHQVHVGAAADHVDPRRAGVRAAAAARRGSWRRPGCAAGARANSGSAASLNDTALAAMTCSSGPPCWPGNTEELNFLASASSLVRMMPPRGPPRVLCVVEVTTCACGTGEGCSPAATRPAKWAMSTIR